MYSQVAANKRKTIGLILVFILLISGLGWVISQVYGSPVVFIGITVFAVAYAGFGYFASAKLALALAGAKPVTKKQAPQLYRIVENLSITAGLPMPKVYIINDPSPNAFATGRNPQHAAVAVNTGLVELLEDEELEGVLAHELSHVGNYDIRVMAIVLVLVTVVAFISDMFFRLAFWGGLGDDEDSARNPAFLIVAIVAAISAPIIAALLQLAVSRKREFLADASGALLTRYPQGLANALQKIATYKGPAKANSATAHMYFSNPLKNRQRAGLIASLFSTHPPLEERIARLQGMESKV
jgi:heat shock protein HtpX